jgi:hypothetical protein
MKKYNYIIYLYNISKIYIQFKIDINKIILIKFSKKIAIKYLFNLFIKIIKLLYNIFEIDIYWFKIYNEYYKIKLEMKILIYDFYLLIINLFDIFEIINI